MSQFSHIKMTRQVAEDGMAEEEYDFNTEVTLQSQVHVSRHADVYLLD